MICYNVTVNVLFLVTVYSFSISVSMSISEEGQSLFTLDRQYEESWFCCMIAVNLLIIVSDNSQNKHEIFKKLMIFLLLNAIKTIFLLLRSQKKHPGAVMDICENPVNENKLLISFKTGLIVLWDLKNQSTEQRYKCDDVSVAYAFPFSVFLSKCEILDLQTKRVTSINTQKHV